MLKERYVSVAEFAGDLLRAELDYCEASEGSTWSATDTGSVVGQFIDCVYEQAAIFGIGVMVDSMSDAFGEGFEQVSGTNYAWNKGGCLQGLFKFGRVTVV